MVNHEINVKAKLGIESSFGNDEHKRPSNEFETWVLTAAN